MDNIHYQGLIKYSKLLGHSRWGKKKTKAIEGKIVNSKLHINLLTHRIQLKESKRIKAWELKNCTFTHPYRIQLRESECIEPTS